VPPQKIPKFNAKLLISLTSTAQIRRELSNSGGLDLSTWRTRKVELLEFMQGDMAWCEFLSQLTVVPPPKATGRPLFAHETVLRLNLLQLFGLSDFTVEAAPLCTAALPDWETQSYRLTALVSCASIIS
jgi:hypothetical protein